MRDGIAVFWREREEESYFFAKWITFYQLIMYKIIT